jgi:hypothetical protein
MDKRTLTQSQISAETVRRIKRAVWSTSKISSAHPLQTPKSKYTITPSSEKIMFPTLIASCSRSLPTDKKVQI